MKKSLIFAIIVSLLGWYLYNKNLDRKMASVQAECQEKTREMVGNSSSFADTNNCDCMIKSMRKEHSILNDYVLNKPKKRTAYHFRVCSRDVYIFALKKKFTEVSDDPEDTKHYTCVASKMYDHGLREKPTKKDIRGYFEACRLPLK